MSKREILSYLLSSNTTLTTKEISISLAVALITTIVMLVIGSNLALSLGMVGSLSIIRFRTAVKEPRDIAFMFWAICIGLACGARMFEVITIGSIIIALVLVVFKFDIYSTNNYLLVVKMSGETSGDGELSGLLQRYAKKARLRMQNVSEQGVEITYELAVSDKKRSGLLEELQKNQQIENYNLVSYNGEMVG